MRKLSGSWLLLILVLCCVGTTMAQSEPPQVITHIEQALREKASQFNCVSRNMPQGEPGPETPRGSEYSFQCQQDAVVVQIFIFYGDSKRDAVRSLDFSQKFLSINLSKPVEGFGEQAYLSGHQRHAWITFRKGRVFGQVSVGSQEWPRTTGSSQYGTCYFECLYRMRKVICPDPPGTNPGRRLTCRSDFTRIATQ